MIFHAELRKGSFYLISQFYRNLVQFRWLGGVLWLSPVENALKDFDPGIHAMWLWANVLLFEICQGVFFQKSVDTLGKFVQIVYELKF